MEGGYDTPAKGEGYGVRLSLKTGNVPVNLARIFAKSRPAECR